MHPYVITVLFAVGFLMIFAFMILRENRKQRKTILKKIRRTYGKVPDQEYEPGDIEKISHYFMRKEKTGFTIDDITWNDLDMDHVFMLINQTVSSPGQDVLYDMLRTPLFSKENIRERERLITFFASHEKEREEMQLLLSNVGKTRLGSLSDTVLALSDAPRVSPGIHVFMLVLLLISLVVILPMAPLYGFFVFTILSIVNITIYYAGKDRTIIDAYLDCFASLLRMLSVADKMETVNQPELQMQMEAIQAGKKAFVKIRRKAFFLTNKSGSSGDILQILLDYVRMVFHVDVLTYNRTLDEIQDKVPFMMQLMDHMGELDAAISIASFRELLQLQCEPEFLPYDKGAACLTVENLYHPLIREAVANTISVQGGTLITGSNASGKSTFLKNLAMNSILAQTIHTCVCSRYQAPFLKVMTSMALRDNLYAKESYFIVEIKSLKRILDESQKQVPILCIIDEVLRGTNTIERIAASSQILRALSKPWVLPFAATHDIELSYILEELYHNYHFEEEIKGKEVIFNYILKEGRATTRNAIKLLGVLAFEEELVKNAEQAAISFEQTGVWKTWKGEY